MTVGEWMAIVGMVIALMSAIYSTTRFMVKAIMRELTPNGGASMKDQISRIERRLDTLYETLIIK